MTTLLGFGRSLGVMQGRLGPMDFGSYQAFPTENWRREFDLAALRSLDHIEWVVDSTTLHTNPLMKCPGMVVDAISATGVKVVSVCADFLMDQPLRPNDDERWQLMDLLVEGMQLVGAQTLVVPCVDQSSLTLPGALRDLRASLTRLDQCYKGPEIGIALETDLEPIHFRHLLEDTDPSFVGVNYDIGNSASLGFKPEEEFRLYGDRIKLVHIKDRLTGGASVPLGSGDADLRLSLKLLRQASFNGPITLQCFRDQEGIAVLDEQLAYLLYLARTV